MAPIKRKAQVEERDVKRSKADASESAPPKKRQPTEDKEPGDRNPVKASILQQEDRAFPRGGASVLTPLEHKQIKIQAERDVLFEQAGGKKQKPNAYSDDEDDDDENAEPGADGASVPSKKKRKTKADKRAAKAADDKKPQVKIFGLSYKNISVGTMVLGQVTDITSRDVALALPNNLTGYIPLTAVSEKVNQKIEALLAQADEDVNEDSDADDDDLDLKSLFHVGQWLRAVVTSTADDSTSKGLRKSKKRIELSVNPKQTNVGLDVSNLPHHSTLQASVRSVEDHGLVMDLGLDDDSVRGFVSKKDLGKVFDMSKIHEGQVMLSVVTGKASDGKVIKLAPDFTKMGDMNKHCLSDAPTIDAFLPGTAVEVLITEASRGGIATKVMGMLDATADVIHSGAGARVDVSKKYKIGSKVKARVICTFHSAENKKIGISFLDHIKTFKAFAFASERKADKINPSDIIDDAKVVHVEAAMGLFLKLPSSSNPAFAHISRISDDKIDTLLETTGKYKLESTHRVRVLGFNPIDAIYNVSLEQKILDQPFLRIEDVEVGQIVKATVEKIILGAKGVTGVLVKLADGLDGLVPESHMADVKLQHPEKKFREGFPVTARVISVDTERNQIRLTLKKTLVNAEAKIWKSYEDINVGDEAPGTIINIKPNGAVVQFYGKVRAWLPVAEMSEAYIADPSQHFRQGQTVMVHALSVDAESSELKVSCKDASAFGKDEESAWNNMKEGQLINATVTEVTGESIMLDVEGSNLKGTLRLAHLSDGSEAKNRSTIKQIRVGQKLNELVVLEKMERRHLVILSNKPSLVKAATSKTIISQFKDLSQGQEVSGFVRNITPDGVFVEFAAGLVGFMPKTQIAPEKLVLPAFGLRKDQSISARVLSVKPESKRFVLTTRPQEEKTEELKIPSAPTAVANPVDGVTTSLTDFTLGKETKARITSIKDTQLNVLLADNIQGRIDVSEVFESWDDIVNRKKPLQKFKAKQIIPVRVLGIHDARNHRFLPITHRHSRVPVLELTAKMSTPLEAESDLLTFEKVEVGSTWVAYVNNIDEKCLWVNLSPNVRGRISLLDVSDDVSLLQDISKNFPIGSAIRVKVKSVDASAKRLDLVAASTASSAPITLESLTDGQILAGRVTKVSERNVIVQLSSSVSGMVTLTELSDDFTQANPTVHKIGDIVRVCVANVDLPNKRVYLSMRPSKVLSSALPIEDRQITSIPQLAVNDVVRGFVKAVTDKGVIVNLGPRVDAFIRISDLTDSYVKEWKSAVEIDQLVKGKILQVDATLNHVQMSLKQSHVDKDYVPALSFSKLKVGQFVTGVVRKVEDFGVFIDVDDTIPRVSGLCHKSQLADTDVEDVKKLYDAGDLVKAKIVHINREKRQVSFGLKASYFKDLDSDEEMEDVEEEESEGEGVALDDDASESDDGVDIDLADVQDMDSDEEAAAQDEDMSDDDAPASRKSIIGGLTTSGFDWSGASALDNTDGAISDAEEASAPLKKRKRKAAIQVDQTGDLDANGPQSVADFERMLLTSPSDSSLWIQYMAFQLGLSEVQKAREIGQRALRTIHLREQDEKQNVWIALLNLEVAYGEPETVESTFKEACQVQDSFCMHEKLAAIYTSSGNLGAAEKVFESMASTKSFRPNGNLWLNYATFLLEKRDAADQARALLPRALQSVPSSEHRNLTAKFAALEFRSSSGEPERARTIFESILSQWPKWTQGWDMWVDLERSLGKQSGDKEDVARVRALFERMTGNGKTKKRRARFVFKRWLEFEEEMGDGVHVEAVKARAKAFVEKMQSGGGGGEDDMEE
jgi:rRNA biogenesis protein RRP5